MVRVGGWGWGGGWGGTVLAGVMWVLAGAACFPGDAEAAQFAVLVAGSRGFYNYRHHADVCHAFHSLVKRGVPKSNIVTMLYDDVAQDRRNPFPGKLFNKPGALGGVDVYAGCQKDYVGSAVTPETFLAVLTGDAGGAVAAAKKAGFGSGAVLRSTGQDDVFVNFVDHGAPGMVAFPRGELLAEQLAEALATMQRKKMFKKLVFYLESCESGSMFLNLTRHANIYAVTAANAVESSYGTFCPPSDDLVHGRHVGTCLGDEFSVNWMMDTDDEPSGGQGGQGGGESLGEQYARVKRLTTKSHSLQFGNTVAFDPEQIGDFLGRGSSNSGPRLMDRARNASASVQKVDARDVPLVSKFYRYLESKSEQARAELDAELAHRVAVDRLFARIVGSLQQKQRPDSFYLDAGQVLERELPHNWSCHRAAHDAFRGACTAHGDWPEYALKYSRSLKKLCDDGVPAARILAAIRRECSAVAFAQT